MINLRCVGLLFTSAVLLVGPIACSRYTYYTHAGCVGMNIVGSSQDTILAAIRQSAIAAGYTLQFKSESNFILTAKNPERSLMAGAEPQENEYGISVDVLNAGDAVSVSLDPSKIAERVRALLPQSTRISTHSCSIYSAGLPKRSS